MSTRFLLTGGAGFIGSHIVKRLVGEGAVVRVVDNLSTGQVARLETLRCSIEYVEADLADNLVSVRNQTACSPRCLRGLRKAGAIG